MSTNIPNTIEQIFSLINNDLLDINDSVKILQKINDKHNEKSWNTEYMLLLRSIFERSQCYRYIHELSGSYFNKLSLRFTYTSMFFSLILSSFTLISFELQLDNTLISLISGIGHLFSGSLTGIKAKMNLPEKSEAHRKICKEFDTLCREIEYQLKLPIDDRKPVPKYIFDIIDRYESIISSSPKIPSSIIKTFRYWASHQLIIDQPNIIKTFKPLDELSQINTVDKLDIDSEDITDLENNINYNAIEQKECRLKSRKFNNELKTNPNITTIMKKKTTYEKRKGKKGKKRKQKLKSLTIKYKKHNNKVNMDSIIPNNSSSSDISNNSSISHQSGQLDQLDQSEQSDQSNRSNIIDKDELIINVGSIISI